MSEPDGVIDGGGHAGDSEIDGGGHAVDGVMDGVAVTAADGVLTVTLARPERRNAIDPAAVLRVVHTLEAASTDDTLRVVLLRSSGDDFCSGANWVATNAGSPSSDPAAKPRAGSIQRRTPIQAHRLIELITEVQLPVVCRVSGWAAGLGCQMALAADFTVAADSSRFWEPFMQRGFTPDSGATWLLPRLIGVARAKELLFLSRELSGREAADWGMIHRAVPLDELDAAVDELVGRLASGPTVAIGLTKRCLQRGLVSGLKDTMEAEANALELSSRTKDFREGLAAFTERRRPDFTGR